MNTKIILLLAFLLTANHTSSVAVNPLHNANTTNVEQAVTNNTHTTEKPSKTDFPYPEPKHDHESKHAEKGHKEHEDGKHHYFHFSRISSAQRRRNLIITFGKIILTLLHISVFLYCFYSVFSH